MKQKKKTSKLYRNGFRDGFKFAINESLSLLQTFRKDINDIEKIMKEEKNETKKY